jgi:hypothetical protein
VCVPVLQYSQMSRPDAELSPVAVSNKMSFLGRIFFLPHQLCRDECYVGLPLHSEGVK